MKRRRFLAAALLTPMMPDAPAADAADADVPPPAPYGAVPSPRQLRWHALEYYGFVHFTTNTFTDKEWGYGDESPAIFDPTEFDADALAKEAAAVGMRGLILTCKHHDGFCLWPTKTTGHNVSRSPFRGGKGDVVRELSDACKRHKLLFGVYLSPWDRNHPEYGTPSYVALYREQLRELLTRYGNVFEVWHDGANGGDGYYGGRRETRRIDQKTYYDWPTTWEMVRRLQSDAVIFSDVGPDVRWVGNERGLAGDPSWSTCDPPGKSGDGAAAPGSVDASVLPGGQRGADRWLPAECDVSIRPGWFWHAAENDRVRTPENLMDLYFGSVGRGASFLLNVPPDRRGRWHENDVAALRGFKKLRDATFGRDLAAGARAAASAVRGGGSDRRYAAANLRDGKPDTYWATDDDVTTPAVTLVLPKPVTFNVVRLREHLPLGHRVDEFAIDVWEGNAWAEIARKEAIGNCRLVRTRYATTDRVRLRITRAAACPALTEFALFAEPVRLGAPRITRDRQGTVSLLPESPGPDLRYTTDGSEPSPSSPRYDAPFALPRGGTVRARVFGPDGTPGAVASETFGLAPAKWKVVSVSAEAPGGEAARLFDGDPRTLWHTHGPQGEAPPPHEVVIDLGETVTVTGFTYLPRRDGTARGMVDSYAFYVSPDGKTWPDAPASQGEFSNIRANPVLQAVPLPAPVTGRFVRFVARRAVEANHVAVAEIGVTVE